MSSTHMRKINVGILGELPPANRGGVGIHILNLSNNLARQDEIGKVYVISSGSKNKDIHHGNLHIYFRKIPFKKRYTTFQRDLVKIKFAKKFIEDIDVLHLHGIFSPFNFLLSNEIPLVVTAHGYPSLETVAHKRIKKDSLQFKFMRYIERKTAQRADAIIAVGKTLREWIIKELGADAEKVFYVPNGIDIIKFRPLNLNNNLAKFSSIKKNQNEKILIYSKALTKQNGIYYLITALPEVIKKYPTTKLVILGKGPEEKNIKKLIQRLKIKKNVLFLGYIDHDDMPYYLNLASLFVLPSAKLMRYKNYFLGEVSPLSIREAMACGLPVIATSVGGNKEILEDGKNKMGNPVGILVPPEDPKALADAIIDLLDNPEYAQRMGLLARDYIVKNYTWDIVAKKTIEVYRYAMENHKN